MGAFLYPNEFNQSLKINDKYKRLTLALIQKTLYSFSNNNLHKLLKNYASFRTLLSYCLENKDEIFFSKLYETNSEKSDKPVQTSSNLSFHPKSTKSILNKTNFYSFKHNASSQLE